MAQIWGPYNFLLKFVALRCADCRTDASGEFNSFLPINFVQNLTQTTMVELFVQNVEGPGNGSAFLVPETGYGIVSDIDDVLRVTKIYEPLTGLRNSFAEVSHPFPYTLPQNLILSSHTSTL